MTQGARPGERGAQRLSLTEETDHRRSATMLAAASAALILIGCAPAKQEVKEAPRSVTVARAARQDLSISQEYAARIKAHEEIVVRPRSRAGWLARGRTWASA